MSLSRPLRRILVTLYQRFMQLLGEADCSRFSALYVSFGTLGKFAWADATSNAPIPP